MPEEIALDSLEARLPPEIAKHRVQKGRRGSTYQFPNGYIVTAAWRKKLDGWELNAFHRYKPGGNVTTTMAYTEENYLKFVSETAVKPVPA